MKELEHIAPELNDDELDQVAGGYTSTFSICVPCRNNCGRSVSATFHDDSDFPMRVMCNNCWSRFTILDSTGRTE